MLPADLLHYHRDLTAELLSEVCRNVEVEPNLQPLIIIIIVDTGKTALSAGYIQEGGDPQNKKGVNYNKSSPKIQLLNCSSDSVSMM